ncbi:MAG: cytochrome c peroxidase, partial [Phenylobacterium sp.]
MDPEPMKFPSTTLLLTSSLIFCAPLFAADHLDHKKATAQSLKIALGKLIFDDKDLSQPQGQSCSSCHQASAGYSDPKQVVSPGAIATLFGNRNAPSIAYAKFNPELYWDKEEAHWVGGFFYDGRAKTLQQQADKPFTNPLEMGNPSNAALIAKVKQAPYAQTLSQLYGDTIWDNETTAINAITDAIVAYENGPEFAPFSAKYDQYLNGKVTLTELEKHGLELFEAEDKGNCAACHPSQPGENNAPPLFTDFTYDNLGLSKNLELPFLKMSAKHNPAGKAYVDMGLAANPHINDGQQQQGKFKVPTLRNIAKSAPYMHNGIFTTLEEVVDFYNTRDVKDSWGKPDVNENVNTDELGDLKLSEDEVKALVAFMETLSDNFIPSNRQTA